MRLHEQVKIKNKEIEIYKQHIANLYKYLNSDKFFINHMVNKSDIFLRLDEMKQELFEM